jgi:FdhE protein
MLSEAGRALEEESWPAALDAEPADEMPSLSDAPLLHRRRVPVDPAQIQRLFLALAAAAAKGQVERASSLRRYQPSRVEVLSLVTAAVRLDNDTIDARAAEGEVDAGALASVAHLTAFPLLQSCRRVLEGQVPRHWPHGYCPTCAAWPILAERRGLDRSRQLRCGRCGTEWEIQWLCCVYCGERDHERLGSLVPDQPGEILKVETCASCRGYLKSVATLQAIPPFELLLQDLETVELDLVALDRGYVRPAEGGFALDVRLT